jgi:large-conductance mechanosensitive channel
MKASIITAVANLIGAVIIAVSVTFVGFMIYDQMEKQYDQKEKHHKREMDQLESIRDAMRLLHPE